MKHTRPHNHDEDEEDEHDHEDLEGVVTVASLIPGVVSASCSFRFPRWIGGWDYKTGGLEGFTDGVLNGC